MELVNASTLFILIWHKTKGVTSISVKLLFDWYPSILTSQIILVLFSINLDWHVDKIYSGHSDWVFLTCRDRASSKAFSPILASSAWMPQSIFVDLACEKILYQRSQFSDWNPVKIEHLCSLRLFEILNYPIQSSVLHSLMLSMYLCLNYQSHPASLSLWTNISVLCQKHVHLSLLWYSPQAYRQAATNRTSAWCHASVSLESDLGSGMLAICLAYTISLAVLTVYRL